MLLKNHIINNIIITHRAIFSALYIGKSLGKQDHYDNKLISSLDGSVMSVGQSSSHAHL